MYSIDVGICICITGGSKGVHTTDNYRRPKFSFLLFRNVNFRLSLVQFGKPVQCGDQLNSTVSTPGKKLAVDTVRGKEDKASNKVEKLEERQLTNTKSMQHDNIQTVRNGTVSTPESVLRKRGERKRRRLRTTFRVGRERVTCESRSPNTAHKPYPGPSNTDPQSLLTAAQCVS